MTPKQEAAAKSLKKALEVCAESKLGVYIFDGAVHVCPQPTGSNHPEWENNCTNVCEEIGMSISVRGLICDGGAGC